MYNHAPPDYECPFCLLQHAPDSGPWQRNHMGQVFEEGSVSAWCRPTTGASPRATA